eukprot:2426569-Amphidinium_carterae.1
MFASSCQHCTTHERVSPVGSCAQTSNARAWGHWPSEWFLFASVRRYRRFARAGALPAHQFTPACQEPPKRFTWRFHTHPVCLPLIVNADDLVVFLSNTDHRHYQNDRLHPDHFWEAIVNFVPRKAQAMVLDRTPAHIDRQLSRTLRARSVCEQKVSDKLSRLGQVQSAYRVLTHELSTRKTPAHGMFQQLTN